MEKSRNFVKTPERMDARVIRYLAIYHAYAAQVVDIVFFEYGGDTYFTRLNKFPADFVRIDKDSKTGEDKLRLALDNTRKHNIIERGEATRVGRAGLIDKYKPINMKDSNKGHATEAFALHYFDVMGDNVGRPENFNGCAKFTTCGDILLNGKHVQVKYENGSIATLKMLDKLADRG